MDHTRAARRIPDGVERLTFREGEVLQQLASGQTNRRIADGLCVSTKTVEYHLRHIFQKLSVRNRTQAVVRAGRLGLIVPLTGGEVLLEGAKGRFAELG